MTVVAVLLSLPDAALAPALSRTGRGPDAVAVLQGEGPPLVDVLDRLAGRGVVRIVGVTATPSAPPASWIGRVAAHWWRGRGDEPHLEVARDVVRLERDDLGAFPEAFAAAAAGPARRVSGTEAPLTSPAWEVAPEHRHHLLLCRGVRCTARGADAVAAAVAAQLRGHGMGDGDVLVTQTGCLYPCNHAPVARVHPAGTWLTDLTPDDVSDVIDHLR